MKFLTVLGSDFLDKNDKAILENMIVQYTPIKFEENAEFFFDKEKFRVGLIRTLFLKSNERLNIEKLQNRFFARLERSLFEYKNQLTIEHKKDFTRWLDNIMDEIKENIVELNPLLHSQSVVIREETEKIMKLEDNQMKLRQYCEELIQLMEWKRIE